MKLLVSNLIFLLLSTLLNPLQAPAGLPITTAFERTVLFAGPGATFLQTGFLNPGLEVQITERNRTGIWVHVKRFSDDGNLAQDGWVISGHLNRSDDLRFSDIPVNDELNDADPSTVNSRSMSRLYTVPIIPVISDAMLAVFQQGQQAGNNTNVITKVGDSLSASPQYLNPLSNSERILGPYDYLVTTIDYYGKSMATDSIAARIGLSTYAIFDPFWADKDQCQPNESPLDCEYRLKKPSVAFIMFGPNDVRSMTDDKYAEQMKMIIEDSLQHSVIPVVSTFSAHPDEEFFWQSINFNLELVKLAEEYQFPLINLWAAARVLPEYGLDKDKVHLKTSGFDYLKYDTGHEAFYGVSLHNLLSICTLDAIRLKLGIEVSG